MKCPVCDDVMYRKEDVVRQSIFYEKYSLHCLNANCPAVKEINYISHMSVLSDSTDWTWTLNTCYEYHLPFKDKGVWYHLVGKQEAFNATVLRTNDDPKPLIFVDFIPIRPDEDMHQHAWKLFHRLKDLLVFT